MLESLLHVAINGPPVEKCLPLIKQAVQVWLEKKPKRKLPSKSNTMKSLSGPQAIELQYASIQTKESTVLKRDNTKAAMKDMMLVSFDNDIDNDEKTAEDDELF